MTDPSPPSPLRPVLTPEGWEMLNSLPPYDAEQSLTLSQRLRRQGHPPDTVSAALTQSRLRAAAEAKFGDFASRMLFTEDGLQQATRLSVAARHAERFRDAGVAVVADLGCGLGGDALAAAALGMQVIAVEADETTAAAATVNLSPFPEARVRHTTAEEFIETQPTEEAQRTGLWLDPARRDPHGARTAEGSALRLTDPESFSPPLSLAVDLAAAGRAVGVKLGPGIAHGLVPEGCEAEWVSVDGDVVEVALWFGSLARPGVRRAATVLRRDAPPVQLTDEDDFGAEPAHRPTGVEGLTGVLWEPDGAVIRAGLVAECAELCGGRILDEHIAYFCAPEGAPVPEEAVGLARGYRILERLPFSVKRLKRWAAEHGVSRLEIKKRGVDVAPEQLRTQILGSARRRPAEGVSRTLILTRLGEERVAVVAEPLNG
ncbi:MAG: SAM-dependent methyltransferase [Nesterenkonia sp.]|nr:SAM-dependent methyltransferase [Nesterenkonia sp.]